jgi:hypothetical protein
MIVHKIWGGHFRKLVDFQFSITREQWVQIPWMPPTHHRPTPLKIRMGDSVFDKDRDSKIISITIFQVMR